MTCNPNTKPLNLCYENMWMYDVVLKCFLTIGEKSLKNVKSCDWHKFKNFIYSCKVFFSVKLRARLSSYVSDDVDLRILKVNYSSRLGVIKLAFSPLSSVCVWNFSTTLDSRPIIINIPSFPWPFFPQPVELRWAVFVSAYIRVGCLCTFNSLFELPIKYNVFLGRCTCLDAVCWWLVGQNTGWLCQLSRCRSLLFLTDSLIQQRNGCFRKQGKV